MLKLREDEGENEAGVLQNTRDAIRAKATPEVPGTVPRNDRDAHLSGTWNLVSVSTRAGVVRQGKFRGGLLCFESPRFPCKTGRLVELLFLILIPWV